ncbi:MAG: sortase [Oscillospiraceae bacterium]|nr:sortase [Oscillospiraceae bacterium]
MSKKKGVAILATGVLLVLLSLTVFLYNQVQDQRAGQLAQTKLEALQTAMNYSVGLTLEQQQIPSSSIPQNAIELDGERYIGYLSIPALELELPVMSDWDYEKLKSAPCRQFGSAKTNDLVIAAHNYKKHFARLTTLKQGEGVLFCEVDGTVHSYTVERVDTLKPTEVDRVKNSERDLVLYTCTYGGKARTAVFCGRTNR